MAVDFFIDSTSHPLKFQLLFLPVSFSPFFYFLFYFFSPPPNYFTYASCYLTSFCWWISWHGQLNDVVDSLKDDEPLLDPVLVHMGSMYSTLRKFEKSVLMYQRAINIMESKFSKFICGSLKLLKVVNLLSLFTCYFFNCISRQKQCVSCHTNFGHGKSSWFYWKSYKSSGVLPSFN